MRFVSKDYNMKEGNDADIRKLTPVRGLTLFE